MSDAPASIDPRAFATAQSVGPRPGGARPLAASWRRFKVAGGLAAADAASALGSLVIFDVFLVLQGAPVESLTITAVVALAGLLVCLHRLLGLYENCRSSPIELFRLRVFAAIVLATFVAATLGAGLALPVQLLSAAILVGLLVVLESAGVALARWALIRLGLWQAAVVLVGEGDATARLAAELGADPNLGMRVVGRADFDTAASLRSAAGSPAEIAILVGAGDRRETLRVAAKLDFPSVIIVSDVGELQSLWLYPRAVGEAVGIEVRRFLVARNLVFKRAFDLTATTLLAIPALPIVLALAAAVWSVDRRNPFYAQPRVGRAGAIVRVWKLRSMHVDAEARLKEHLRERADARAEWEHCFKLADDPRILPGIGRFIRRSSLDELPQLWNVLRGEMSLVGPRPFPAYHLDSFDEEFRQLRASVVPGLTGLWQITSRSDGDLARQRSADTFYVRNWSVWLDLYILIHTLPAVVIARGAR